MSNRLTSLAYKVDVRTNLRKSVLVLMADKASDDGTGIWASRQTMADELNCAKRSIDKTIDEFLAERVLIKTGKRHCANGYTVVYALNVGVLESLPRVGRWSNDGCTTNTSAPRAPVQQKCTTGAPVAPKPSKNHPYLGADAPPKNKSNPRPTEHRYERSSAGLGKTGAAILELGGWGDGPM